jgi:hypothetical protein
MFDIDIDFFTKLPYQTIIMMIKQLLKETDGNQILDRLLNIENFKLISCCLFYKKSLCLINTRLWLKIIYSMGTQTAVFKSVKFRNDLKESFLI